MQRIWVWFFGLCVTVCLALPVFAAPQTDVAPLRTVSGDTALAPKLPPAVKKNATKKKKKAKPKKKRAVKKLQKKKKKKAAPKAKKHSLGFKGAMLPFNDMNVVRPGSATGDTREIDYDFGVIWGFGAQYQYRLAKNFYMCGEFLYWFPKVSDTSNHPETVPNQVDFREKDALINLGLGLRYNFLGGEHTTDRVYLKGHAGFTDYSGDDANLDNGNRMGLYFNLGAGIEHMFSRTFTVFADGGYFYNSFMSAADGEDEATLQGIVLNAGFLFHWGK